MLRYAPANIPMRTIVLPQLGQGIVPEANNKVPASKWLLDFGILAAGLGLGYLGIYNHKAPLGILAIQAGGSLMGAALVLIAMDAVFPQHPRQTATPV